MGVSRLFFSFFQVFLIMVLFIEKGNLQWYLLGLCLQILRFIGPNFAKDIRGVERWVTSRSRYWRVILWNPKLSSLGHEPQANEASRIYGNSTTRKEKEEEKKKKHTKNTS